MRYRTLGMTGLQVSEVGIGGAPLGIPNYVESWAPDDPASERSVVDMIRRSVDLGYNYIDTAPGYGQGRSEELIGRGLGGGLRAKVHLATKTPWRGKTKADVIQSVAGSLGRLGTDHLDVVQVHGDTGYAYTAEDFAWIMECGPMEALRELRDQGKIRFLGITCEEPTSLVPFLDTAQFDVIQIKYNLIHQGAWHNVLPRAAADGVGVVVMRPLTSGIFQKLLRTARADIDELVDLNRLALDFVLSEPAVSTAIVGMRRPAEAEQNNAISDAAEHLDLDWLQDRRVRA